MKCFLFIALFLAGSLVVRSQEEFAKEMANLESMESNTYKRFFVYTKKGKVVVVSPTQGCRKLYRNLDFDEQIENEAEKQWAAYLAENLLAYDISKILAAEPQRGFVFVENDFHKEKDVLEEIRKFEELKENMIAAWKREGKTVIEEEYFIYKHTRQLEEQLKEQEAKFKEMRVAIREREEKRIQEEKKRAHIKELGSDPVAGQQLGGMAALVYNNNEHGDDNARSFYLKGNFGFGYLSIPVILNHAPADATSTAGTESLTGTAQFLTTYAGLKVAFFNDKIVNWKLSPLLMYGTDIDFSGNNTRGTHVAYGIGTAIGAGKKLRFQVKGEYVKRNGHTKQEFSSSKTAETLDYSYSTLKYGAGMIYNMEGVNEFLEFTVFRENLSFLKATGASVYSFEIKISLGMLAAGWQHGSNYPIAGELHHPSQFSVTKQNFNNFILYVPFTLAKKPK
ncbi:MAG: hypothetical protein DI535_20980 [Citrobacter freundii]|nr:MAG: hypothetical protein DI535_20980 [Citrobacter freundii]